MQIWGSLQGFVSKFDHEHHLGYGRAGNLW